MKPHYLVKACLFFLFLFLNASIAVPANRFSFVRERPPAVESEFGFIYGSETFLKLEWQAGSQVDLALRPFEGSLRGIIDYMLTENFYGGIGMTDWFSVGLGFPVVWINHYQNPFVDPAPGFSSEMDLGDLRLEMKARILSRYQYPVGLAIVPYVHFPTGNAGQFMGDESVLGGALVTTDIEFFRKLLLAINMGIEVTEPVTVSDVHLSAGRGTFGLGIDFKPAESFDLFLESHGTTPLKRVFQREAETPVEFLGGARYRFDNGVFVAAGGGGGIFYGVGAPAMRGYLRAGYLRLTEWQKRKRMQIHDQKYGEAKPEEVQWAVFELKEKCPADPANFDSKVHDPSCPKYYELSQIAALSLKCPSRPEDFDPAVHDQGCPKSYELRKGLSREESATVYVLAASGLAGRCPDDPTQFDSAKHDESCPKFFELKEAVSLVARCPSTPDQFDPEIHDPECPKVFTLQKEFARGDVQAIYILSQADTDGDGILDVEDRCPQIPGIAGTRGCPDVKTGFKTGQLLPTRIPITFPFNKWNMNTKMGKSLNEIAELLINHPEIKKVRIEGHADSRGSRRGNEKVSLRRANVVKKFLESCGIAPARLHAVGLGSKKPIASNKTAKGRMKNRRATALILELVQ